MKTIHEINEKIKIIASIKVQNLNFPNTTNKDGQAPDNGMFNKENRKPQKR